MSFPSERASGVQERRTCVSAQIRDVIYARMTSHFDISSLQQLQRVSPSHAAQDYVVSFMSEQNSSNWSERRKRPDHHSCTFIHLEFVSGDNKSSDETLAQV